MWDPLANAEDYYATMLVNSVLGQFGMMGRIGDIVREEKGMAYYCSSSIEGRGSRTRRRGAQAQGLAHRTPKRQPKTSSMSSPASSPSRSRRR
ncbi:MAG UNVERIFIED_CONTAM: insulinase family protein [Anaerolineae bacterium]